MKSARLVFVALAFVLAGCRTMRPAGTAVMPLVATSADDAKTRLSALRTNFAGMRSLMRVRATVNGKTQSFRAQLHVQDARRMDMIAYTPVGTTALTMKADGDRITTNPPVAPDAFRFLGDAGLTPAQMGMLLLGIPPTDDMRLEFASTGLISAGPGEMAVQFEPPSFPPQRVIVTTENGDRIEITHDEVVREN